MSYLGLLDLSTSSFSKIESPFFDISGLVMYPISPLFFYGSTLLEKVCTPLLNWDPRGCLIDDHVMQSTKGEHVYVSAGSAFHPVSIVKVIGVCEAHSHAKFLKSLGNG